MSASQNSERGKILGIGGIFFKSSESEQLRAWYQDKLGIQNGTEGAMFRWRAAESDEQGADHVTVWNIFPSSTTYFDPAKASFLINYIVDDLEALLHKLTVAGVSIDPKREESEYGRFAWIYDPDGNKIELWQPA